MTGETHFDDAERELLVCVLDAIIPPSADGRLPGAGTLGVLEYVDRALDATPEARTPISAGLAAAREAAQGAGGLAALSPTDRAELLEGLAADHPAFVPSLMFHCYVAYYQDGRVLEALGIEPRPPYPKGYDLEPGDLSRLEAVRQRPPLYRPVGS